MVIPSGGGQPDFFMITSIILFALGIATYSCGQLHIHGKLKWLTKGHGFFGDNSYLRKYQNRHADKSKFQVDVPLGNWYYEFFKIPYRESFPLSATLLVWTTDFYHLMQFLFFLFISLSFAPILGLTWSVIFWGVAHLIHWAVYRFLQR